jgi:hypothetical protein
MLHKAEFGPGTLHATEKRAGLVWRLLAASKKNALVRKKSLRSQVARDTLKT